jgi:pimeloyl-ACP methyl ester carboxylesterase
MQALIGLDIDPDGIGDHVTLTRALTLLAIATTLFACAPKAPAPPLPAGQTLGLPTPSGRIVGRLYRGTGTTRVLVVVLHGDSPKAPVRYHYDLAAAVAHDVPGVAAVGLMRPGYADPGSGGTSAGPLGNPAGGNYTPDVVATLDTAIEDLRADLHPTRVVLVGHSGGAALIGDLMGRYPGIADDAVMVSCPCDVPAWRAWMASKQSAAAWREPVHSLSPQALAGAVATTARLHLWVGARDATALPRFSQAYVDALRRRGIAADLTILPGRKHGILLAPEVVNGIEAVAAR